MSQSDSRKIVKSLLSSLQQIFKNSTRQARERAWNKISSDRGKAEVRRLINNPSMTLNHFDDFLTFKENHITFKQFLLYDRTEDDNA